MEFDDGYDYATHTTIFYLGGKKRKPWLQHEYGEFEDTCWCDPQVIIFADGSTEITHQKPQ